MSKYMIKIMYLSLLKRPAIWNGGSSFLLRSGHAMRLDIYGSKLGRINDKSTGEARMKKKKKKNTASSFQPRHDPSLIFRPPSKAKNSTREMLKTVGPRPDAPRTPDVCSLPKGKTALISSNFLRLFVLPRPYTTLE